MSESPTSAKPKETEVSPGSALRTVIENSKLRMKPGGPYETWWAWTGDAATLDTEVKKIQAQATLLSQRVDAAPPEIQQKFALRMKAFGEQVTRLLQDEIQVADRAKKVPKVKSALTSLGVIDKALDTALEAHAAEEEDRRKIKADQDLLVNFSARARLWKAKTIDPAIGKNALAALTQLETWAKPTLNGTAPLADKNRAGFSGENLDKVGLAFDAAETATRVAKEVADERKRLGGLLDAEMAEGAGPDDVAPGALPGDIVLATEKRKTIAASIAKLPKMEDSPGVVGEIAALKALVDGVKATVAERARLVLVLDTALPANAKPEDVIAGATAQDVAGVMAERAAILNRINTPGTDLATIQGQIDGLKPMIKGVGQVLAAARKEQARLQLEHDRIAEAAKRLSTTNPPGASVAQIQKLDDGRVAVSKALAAPLTKENNKAADDEVTKQQTLYDTTVEAIKGLRKQSDADVGPALRRLRKVAEDVVNLKIGPAVDLTALVAIRQLVTDAQKAGDWAEALKQAGELAKLLPAPEKTVAEMDAFRNGGKLVMATYDAILKKLGDAFTLAEAKAEVDRVYSLQCDVKRDDWLIFLGVAGANVKVGDPNGPHYTTFNAAVLRSAATASTNQSLDALCTELFETGIGPMLRIHATVVDGEDRYHKYWGGAYANHYYNKNLAGTNKGLDAKLTEWYDKLVADMRKKVKEAQDAHGRIGTNRRGPDYV
jgi:hypothetical protein